MIAKLAAGGEALDKSSINGDVDRCCLLVLGTYLDASTNVNVRSTLINVVKVSS